VAWLFEDPTLVIVATALVVTLLAVAFRQTGRVAVLLVAAAVLAGGLVCVVVERLVVTESEEIADLLHSVARSLEAGRVDQLLDKIAPEATEMRTDAQQALSRFRITSARLAQLQVTVHEHMRPPTAQARFLGAISGKDSSGSRPVHNRTAPSQ